MLAFVPDCPGNPEATGRRELLALRKPQVWFAIVAGAVGFGGMFALFSYVAPMATRVGGLPDARGPGLPAHHGRRHGLRQLARRPGRSTGR